MKDSLSISEEQCQEKKQDRITSLKERIAKIRFKLSKNKSSRIESQNIQLEFNEQKENKVEDPQNIPSNMDFQDEQSPNKVDQQTLEDSQNKRTEPICTQTNQLESQKYKNQPPIRATPTLGTANRVKLNKIFQKKNNNNTH